MTTVEVNGRSIRLKAGKIIGKGGEADVYDIGGGEVLKLYKQPGDVDYTNNPAMQQAAAYRLKEQQRKLPAFPRNLPASVVAPVAVALNGKNGTVMGYTMPYLSGMEVLLSYGDRKYRDQGGIDGNQVAAVFQKLHTVVREVHQEQVVIGDFNDLNVLVDGNGEAWLVDADSMQFGNFPCRTFTARFVDPLCCQPDQLLLTTPHNQQSDWYAYNIMLMQSLLYVGPYGGVHRPKTGKRLQHDGRVLQRITVFHPEVVYPRPAQRLDVLPDEMLGHFEKVFTKDLREVFPEMLLRSLRWTNCTNCGLAHARPKCPVCAAPGAVKETVVRRGNVKANRLFRTKGQILHTTFQNGALQYLYHENGAFRREGDRKIIDGQLDPELRFRIKQGNTLVGRRNRLVVMPPSGEPTIEQTDAMQHLPMFDANSKHHYWISNGQLVRDGQNGSFYIGDVLEGRTLFWVGERFGFGFYQAGQLSRSFVFTADGRGINDRVAVPTLPGQLIDATCVVGEKLAWFLARSQEEGRIINRCYVVDQHGAVIADEAVGDDDESWLASGIRGHFASGSSLFVATDEGIVRVEAGGGIIRVDQTFPDTQPFVDSNTKLLPGKGGVYAVNAREIYLLTLS